MDGRNGHGNPAMTPLEKAKADLAKTRSERSRAEMLVKQLEIRQSKIEAYIEMAALYESDEIAAEAARARNGIAASAVRATVDMLTEHKARIHTRDILKALQDKGITIGGNNPAGNLSGFLSRSDELDNSRSEGWGLASWGAVPEPDSESAETAREESTPAPIRRGRAQVTGSIDGPAWEPVSGGDLDDEIPL